VETVDLGYCDYDDEDCNEDQGEADPGKPADLLGFSVERDGSQGKFRIWCILRADAAAMMMLIAMNMYQMVHIACLENVLKAMDTPKIPEPVSSTYVTMKMTPMTSRAT